MSEIQQQLEQELEQYYASPASIMQVTLDAVEAATKGEIDIVDATNPFTMLLEASATHAYASIMKMESMSREMYPVMAQQYEDLYRHMSNADYLDRFARPSSSVISIVIPVNTIRDVAIYDTVTGVGKITIPKDSGFLVSGTAWYVHRPIDILVLANGVIQVAYDLTVDSPLIDTMAKVIQYRIVNQTGVEELVIDIPVEQIDVESFESPVSNSTGFSATYAFNDQFYYARAYTLRGGVWEEMNVTHTDQVFDSTQPTLVVKVSDDQLICRLPEVYTLNGTIGDTIRVDVFTTKGLLNIDLSGFRSNEFQGRWTDLNDQTNPYIQPLSNITNMTVFGSSAVISGRDALSLDALRERVIYRSAERRGAITYEELTYLMKDKGFDLGKAKDTITERRYICSRKLPDPKAANVSSPIAVAHAGISVNVDDPDYGYCIKSNTGRYTLTPDALYKEENDKVNLLNVTDYGDVESTEGHEKAIKLNSHKYLYSPFFYVLDAESDVYNTRVYYLDDPKEIGRNFVDVNPGLPFTITTESVNVERIGEYFNITVVAEVPSGLTDLYCQLVYKDVTGSTYRLSLPLNALTDKTVSATFSLRSNLDLNGFNRIGINNMLAGDGTVGIAYLDLESVFDIYYLKATGVPIASLMDGEVSTSGLPPVSVAAHEQTRISLGKYIPRLYAKARAIINPPVYQKHTSNVQRVYTETVYERDANGNLIWTVDPNTNKPVFNILHEIGDPVFDANGDPVWDALEGDPVLDSYGKPIIDVPETVIWEVEPTLFDARYRYATEERSSEYRDSIPKVILDYIEDGVEPVISNLMARTDLDFQPTATASKTIATVDRNQSTVLDTALSFTVRYTLTPHALADGALKAGLAQSAKEVILEALESKTLSMGDLTNRLMDIGGEDVVSVKVDNPILGYDVAELEDDNVRFSLRSELKYRSDGKLSIEDDIVVSFQ